MQNLIRLGCLREGLVFMRKAVLATALLLTAFLIVPFAQMSAVTANPYSFIKPHITVESPVYYKGQIYQTTTIPIKVTAFPGPRIESVEIYYNLDNGSEIKLSLITYENSAAFFGRGILDNLTNGYHALSAFCKDIQGNIINDSQGNILTGSTTFLVNTTFSYPVLLLSPNNSTYNSAEMPLIYTIEGSQYRVSYQLDSSWNSTGLTSNTTLQGLSEGSHTITARAYDFKTGKIYSNQTAIFTIDTIDPFPGPTQTIPEFPLTIGIMFLAMGAFGFAAVYRKSNLFRLSRHNTCLRKAAILVWWSF